MADDQLNDQETFVKMEHSSHDAVAQAVTLRAFNEVWKDKGWTIVKETQADADKEALRALDVEPNTSKKAGK